MPAGHAGNAIALSGHDCSVLTIQFSAASIGDGQSARASVRREPWMAVESRCEVDRSNGAGGPSAVALALGPSRTGTSSPARHAAPCRSSAAPAAQFTESWHALSARVLRAWDASASGRFLPAQEPTDHAREHWRHREYEPQDRITCRPPSRTPQSSPAAPQPLPLPAAPPCCFRRAAQLPTARDRVLGMIGARIMAQSLLVLLSTARGLHPEQTARSRGVFVVNAGAGLRPLRPRARPQ
ncbi:uncharacterized protein BDZ99DRAFT_524580 [Mytilinidion resinicola]|uniref:Uncharacterized protein n=1 Tax=Mytilinidion resinicola TaxID=574789 RepID=A0A6A6YBZ2_9PEZI|nr:uncharacterized protein BDZ99DRAFT_524580 [Mytilinidion resinicola]KAF2805615.1 hypothetical protein BDZ99DRAFT_524580 [Mytilinidion resinicola]